MPTALSTSISRLKIARENKKVIELMIECLTAGTFRWVAGDEQETAKYLQALI